MGLVTKNVGIIHISLTGPMMYSRVVQCVHANKVFGHEKAVDLRPPGT